MRKRICRKCGREYTGEPAVSKENFLIMICPDCAKKEKSEGHNKMRTADK